AVEAYTESLHVRSLPEDYILFSFHFRSISQLPRALLHIAQDAEASKLALHMTRGRWQQQWGPLPDEGHHIGSTGMEVIATLQDEQQWKPLVNALSGLFCASLNYMDETRSTRPKLAFQDPAGIVMHGLLPSETVCTENLTPFLKLLPCKNKAGIASLLSSRLFNTDFSSLFVEMQDGILEQRIELVIDRQRIINNKGQLEVPGSLPEYLLSCIDKPYNSDVTCFPADSRESQPWTLSQLFGKSIAGTCPVATETELLVDGVPHTFSDGSYDFNHHKQVDAALPPILAKRSLTSQGSSLHGKITLLLNNTGSKPVDVLYYSMLPWFLRPYLHTLISSNDSISQTSFTSAIDRQRPARLEIMLHALPGLTSVSFNIERTVLRYAEYPPDANRGFDIPGAYLRTGTYELRTTPALLSLPTPDFSMPYNVIILTCTVIALCFGSVFNLVSRRIV
ncbi:GPI transamidase component PIG-T, partial [Protomyces lactucae-debilis]